MRINTITKARNSVKQLVEHVEPIAGRVIIDECISAKDALRMFTYNGAYASFEEDPICNKRRYDIAVYCCYMKFC